MVQSLSVYLWTCKGWFAFILEMEVAQWKGEGGGTEVVPPPPRLCGFAGVLSMWLWTFIHTAEGNWNKSVLPSASRSNVHACNVIRDPTWYFWYCIEYKLSLRGPSWSSSGPPGAPKAWGPRQSLTPLTPVTVPGPSIPIRGSAHPSVRLPVRLHVR